MPSRAAGAFDVGKNDGSARVGMPSRKGHALRMPTSADTIIGEPESLAAAEGMAPRVELQGAARSAVAR